MRTNLVAGLLLATIGVSSGAVIAAESSSSSGQPTIPVIHQPIHLRYVNRLDEDLETVDPAKKAKPYVTYIDYWSDGNGAYLIKSVEPSRMPGFPASGSTVLLDSTNVLYQQVSYSNTLYIYPPKPQNMTGMDRDVFDATLERHIFLGFQVPGCPYLTKQVSLKKTASGWEQHGIISSKADGNRQVALTYDKQGRLVEYKDNSSNNKARYSKFVAIAPQVWIPTHIVTGPISMGKPLPEKVRAVRNFRYTGTTIDLQSYDTKKQTAGFFSLQHPPKGMTVCDYRYMVDTNQPLTYTYSGKASIDAQSMAELRKQKPASANSKPR